MKIRVVQIGARKSYAVPMALADAEWLEYLITDFYRTEAKIRPSIYSLLSRLNSPKGLKRIQSRFGKGIPKTAVKTLPISGVLKKVVVLATKKHSPLSGQLWGSRIFTSSAAKLGFDSVSAVYAFSSAALEVFEEAKKRGIGCVLDHETAPALEEQRLIEEVTDRYPSWVDLKVDKDSNGVKAYADRQAQEAELADCVVAPSTFCKRLLVHSGLRESACSVIPFPMRKEFQSSLGRNSKSAVSLGKRKLRVLFVGDDAIRKGLPDLVSALKLLDHSQIETRGIGNWNLSAAGWREAKSAMEVLGGVPRSEVQRHFEWADVFILPTYSDTMGVVILEAMAMAVPVIVTDNSGGPDLVRDGLDGFVVPYKAPDAVASKIDLFATERDRVVEMGHYAKQRAAKFSMQRYQEQLLGEIDSMCRSKH